MGVSVDYDKELARGGAASGIPSQTGNSGKFLKTSGTALSWDTPAGGDAPRFWIDPVEDHGVVGDGTTDDSTAINAAIAAGAASGKPVWFDPSLVYAHSATIVVDTENTTIWGGGLRPARGRGATDTPARTMKCATFKYTGSGDAWRIGKDQATDAGAGTGADFIYNVTVGNIRSQAPSAGSGRGCMVVRNPFQCRFVGISAIGPVGSGRKVVAQYSGVDVKWIDCEIDGVGFPNAVAAAGSGYDNAAEWGMYFAAGGASTLTTTEVAGCYIHYCNKGVYSPGLVNFTSNTIVEACNVGLYLDWNSRQLISGCYFEYNTVSDIYLGRNTSTTIVDTEFLIYATGRTYAFDGSNIADVELRGCSLQNTQTSTPAIFSTNVTLSGDTFSGTPGSGDNSANSRVVIAACRFNKPGWVIGGASSGATFTFDKCTVTDLHIVPYRFKVAVPSQYYNGAITPTTVDGLAKHVMPMKGEVVGLEMQLGVALAFGSYDLTVTHNRSGSHVAVSGLSFAGVASAHYIKKAPHWVSGAAIQADDELKTTFTANTIDATGTHYITVWVAHGQDGRGLLLY